MFEEDWANSLINLKLDVKGIWFIFGGHFLLPPEAHNDIFPGTICGWNTTKGMWKIQFENDLFGWLEFVQEYFIRYDDILLYVDTDAAHYKNNVVALPPYPLLPQNQHESNEASSNAVAASNALAVSNTRDNDNMTSRDGRRGGGGRDTTTNNNNNNKNVFINFTMLVGENNGTPSSSFKAIEPFVQKEIPEGEVVKLTTASYIAIPGKAFVVKIKLTRLMREGSCLGCRVYIDKGDMNDKEDWYLRWDDEENRRNYNDDDDDDNDNANISASNVDFSKADHYFTMSPGEQVYTLEGFFCSASTSKRMVWELPNRKRLVAGDSNVRVASNSVSIGMIRFVFCYLKNRAPAIRNQKSVVRKPKQVAVDNNVEGKIKMSAKPGKKIHDGYSSSNKVLRNDIHTEVRLTCNTFEGFTGTGDLILPIQSVKMYQALPLINLKDPRVRSQALKAFFEKFMEVIDGWMYIAGLVRYVSETLSPAGSYLVCTGEHYCENNNLDYGEKYIQTQDVAVSERMVEIPQKVQGLIKFFEERPVFYECADLENEDFNNFRVKLVTPVDLTKADDDDDDDGPVPV